MEKLNVNYNDIIVGYIVKYNDKYVFEYDSNWLINGFSISPFSLPLKKGVFIPEDNTFNGFFGVFADSMPDAWGNLIIDRYLAKRKINKTDGITRLSLIGKNGMGALEYIPNIELEESFNFSLDSYQDECNKILNKEDSNIDFLFKYGASSGGARPKALINIDGINWLIKFESKYDANDFGLLEYEYALACKEIGINMPNVKLFESKYNSGYFGVERFDRKNDKKIHMISVAALLKLDFRSPCIDYSELFKLTKVLTKNNINDLENLFLRMVFNVYAHNLDDHAKNFSFLYDEDTKTYRLSPAYDMTYSNTYYGEHTTSINGKGINILDEDLLEVGKKAGLKIDFMNNSILKIKEIVDKRLKKYLI
jgi:serine/threonine-protein kinase HipA